MSQQPGPDEAWKDLVRAREAFLAATAALPKADRVAFLAFLQDRLRSPEYEAAIATVELLVAGDQAPFVEDFVELIGDDVRWAYRCIAILRSITDVEVVVRIERKASEILGRNPDYYSFLRLISLLREFDLPAAERWLDSAAKSPNPEIVEAAALLRDGSAH